MDSFWLDSAFFHATRAIGSTGKNPAVGCILVKDNEIVGVGSTSINGRPHAEENAIEMAGKKASGSDMYVSLEPCNLDENENSCTKLIIKAGIKKVIIGMLDPNPLTYKKGYKELIKNKVEVKVIKPSLNNILINYSHYCKQIKKRPMIALKMATSIDSRITKKSNEQWITSSFARNHVHQLRSLYDAVLVGTNTMIIDNPTLNTRLYGYNKPNTRIVFDSNLKIDLNSKIVKSIKKNPLIIFVSSNFDEDKYKKLKKLGVHIYKVSVNSKKLLSVKEAIQHINETSIKSILVEGGAKTASGFLDKKLVDIIFIYRSNCFIGNESLSMFDKIRFNQEFELYNEVTLDDNKLEVWTNKEINITKRLV